MGIQITLGVWEYKGLVPEGLLPLGDCPYTEALAYDLLKGQRCLGLPAALLRISDFGIATNNGNTFKMGRAVHSRANKM